ncbi:hypothetical protein [Salinicoccus carnicancri]|uniref:hypothetical protein n=1 Tax=Salinicoccus carnicancri TaxID=558170 RepID=UPI0002DA2440|nr:hypothetical protein [Salinicoccus carnicancri]
MKKYLEILSTLSLILILGACSDSNESEGETTEENTDEETAEDTNEEASEDSESEDGEIHEIGDTVEVESFEWELPYEVTVNSFEQSQEYNGEPIDTFVMNAGESHFLGIVNLTVKNTGEEAIVIGEYVHPDIVQGGEMGGEQFIFDVSEEDLSQELQADEEATFDLVYIMTDAIDSDYYELKFENNAPTEQSYRLPLE